MSLDNLKEYNHAIVSFLNALRYDVKHRDQLADNVAVVASNISQFTEESLQKFEGKKFIKHSHSSIFVTCIVSFRLACHLVLAVSELQLSAATLLCPFH